MSKTPLQQLLESSDDERQYTVEEQLNATESEAVGSMSLRAKEALNKKVERNDNIVEVKKKEDNPYKDLINSLVKGMIDQLEKEDYRIYNFDSKQMQLLFNYLRGNLDV